MSFSGFFSATFPLVFAYISDCVDGEDRAPAYGLALAAFGSSICVGPMLGAFFHAHAGSQSVFALSVLLVIFDILYILFLLPETVTFYAAHFLTCLKIIYNTTDT